MVAVEEDVATLTRVNVDRALDLSHQKELGCFSVAMNALLTAYFPLSEIPADLLETLDQEGPEFEELFMAMRGFTESHGISVEAVQLRADASRRILDTYSTSFQQAYPDNPDRLTLVPDNSLTRPIKKPVVLLMHKEGMPNSHIITDNGRPNTAVYIEDLLEKGFNIEGIVQFSVADQELNQTEDAAA